MIMVATLVHLWRHFWNISCSLQATLLPLLSHFLGTAARLSTFVGRPWSPRCCDNLRTCEVRGINHISPFFDWGLGFSHVRLANATYYYLVLKVIWSRNRIVEQPAVLQRVPKAMPMWCAPIQCSMYMLLFVLVAHIPLVLTQDTILSVISLFFWEKLGLHNFVLRLIDL